MKKLLILAACVFGMLIGGQPAAHADVNDFIVHRFDSDMTLTQDDPQGQLHIVENIKLTFNDNNHGILRALPDSYNNHSLELHINKVTSPSGAPSEYTTYKSNGNTVLKVGSPTKTVTGNQEYIIDYTVSNVISFKNDDQKLIWNVNGTEWSQTFENVSVALHNKSGFTLGEDLKCFTGRSASDASSCTITQTEDGVKAETTSGLGANENLTYQVGFVTNSFAPFTYKDTLAEVIPKIVSILAPILLIGGYSYRLWYTKGRDAKGRGTIIPQYDPPKGLSPLTAGAVIDFRTDTKDITATIIDLAVRKYIKIIEKKEVKTLAKDKLVYSLELLNPDFAGLNNQEITLLKAIFTATAKGEVVDISSLSTKLYSTATQLGKDSKKFLQEQAYFSPKLGLKPILKLLALWVVGGIAFIIAVAYQDAFLIAGLIISGVLSIVFLVLMNSRSAKGVEAKEHMLGLKMYLDVAEKDRIEKLQSPNAPYAQSSVEPVRTVELFEKLLPYAIILGVEGQWAKQFESIYKTPPDWYAGGNWTAFNSAILVSNINSGVGTAVNQAFAAPSSSGSGGFSGGGGGGGGGGGW